MRQTSTQQLLQIKLGRDLATYVKVRQAEGLGWRRIADDLHAETGIRVSHESLRSWFTEAAA